MVTFFSLIFNSRYNLIFLNLVYTSERNSTLFKVSSFNFLCLRSARNEENKKKETKGYPLEPPPIVFDACCFARKEPKFLVELRTFQELSEQKKETEREKKI